MSPSPGLLEAIERAPRLGWCAEPSPITALPAAARDAGLAWLGVKRDDLLTPLFGGSKVRKLDFVLASAPYAGAPRWASSGATGSGHLVAMTAAAALLGRRLDAHVFPEPPSPAVLEHLAYVASGPTAIHGYGSRLSLALRAPSLLIGDRRRGVPVIPPGGSLPIAALGVARGALELARQIEAGEAEVPDRIYVALGSGGTAAGLILGLALGGVRAPVHAIACVERPLASASRVTRLARAGLAALRANAVPIPAGFRFAPLVVDHRHCGAGYGAPTPAGLDAASRVAAEGVALEPIYTGKAMAALLADARDPRRAPKRPLLWLTTRRPEPLPIAPDWRARVPEVLLRSFEPARRGRRRLIAAGAIAGASALGYLRFAHYPALPAFEGRVLSAREALILRAAADAFAAPVAEAIRAEVPARVDRYLVTLPPSMQLEVHGLLALVEHGVPLASGTLSRLTGASAEDRDRSLESLARHSGGAGLLSQAYEGLRALVMLGVYQQDAAWDALGYPGPWVKGPRAASPQDALRAGPDRRPRGWSAG